MWRSINNIAPKPRKILQLLRLLQINNGVFVKVTKATSEMLLRVEPYITYGEVSLSVARQLLYKRGYGKVNKQRVALTDNSIIEGALGKFGILSIEDLLHEIVSAGPHFKEAAKYVSRAHRSILTDSDDFFEKIQLPVALQAVERPRGLPFPQVPHIYRGRRDVSTLMLLKQPRRKGRTRRSGGSGNWRRRFPLPPRSLLPFSGPAHALDLD